MVCVCVRACACVCVCARVHVCEEHCMLPWIAQIVWLNSIGVPVMTLLAMRSTASVSDEATAGAGDEATAGDNAGSHWQYL